MTWVTFDVKIDRNIKDMLVNTLELLHNKGIPSFSLMFFALTKNPILFLIFIYGICVDLKIDKIVTNK